MKTMTCKQMGGGCDHSITEASEEEMMKMSMEHLKIAHPDLAAKVEAMAPDAPEMIEWKKKLLKVESLFF